MHMYYRSEPNGRSWNQPQILTSSVSHQWTVVSKYRAAIASCAGFQIDAMLFALSVCIVPTEPSTYMEKWWRCLQHNTDWPWYAIIASIPVLVWHLTSPRHRTSDIAKGICLQRKRFFFKFLSPLYTCVSQVCVKSRFKQCTGGGSHGDNCCQL